MRHTRSRLPFALFLLGAAPALAGCSAPIDQPAAHDGVVATSPAAQTLLTDLRGRFTVALPPREPAHGLPARPGEEAAPRERTPLLRASQVEAFEQRDGWLVPRLPASAARGLMRPATVRLPAKASGAFEVKDDKSGMRIAVQRVGATDAAGEVAEGWVAYRGGVKGGDVLHLVHAEGTEDYVYFSEKPAREELRYRVDVSAVAGLRLVSNILEFIDETGYPRLRVTAPMALDARGEALALRIEVAGCAYDESPAAPWQRERVKPGASQCQVAVRWEGKAYPVVVDPAFVATGSLAVGRYSHTASLLSNDQVLVVGGTGSDSTNCPYQECALAELWKDGSFSTAGNLALARDRHTASVLSEDRVLIVGGNGDDATNCPSNNKFCRPAEVWKNGTFSAAGALSVGRAEHTANVLSGDRVLVIGGMGTDGTNCPNSSCKLAELWQNGSFSDAGSLYNGRRNHTASSLSGDRVLVVGGTSMTKSAELWQGGTFTNAKQTQTKRFFAAATVQSDDSVLIVGGYGENQFYQLIEVWKDGAFTGAGTLTLGRQFLTASILSGDRVLVVGGENNTDVTNCPNSFCGLADLWKSASLTNAGSLLAARARHTATVLSGDRVIIIGGTTNNSTKCPDGPCKLTEIWDAAVSDLGAPCSSDLQCSSGLCVAGSCAESSGAGGMGGGSGGSGAAGAGGGGATGSGGGAGGPSGAGGSIGQGGATAGAPGVAGAAGAGGGAPMLSDKVGQPCTSATTCGGLACVDGFCCDSACDGPCVACSAAKKGAGLDGLCGPIAAGTDPDGECSISASFPEDCGADGFCDGLGACRAKAPTTTACGDTTCAAGVVEGELCSALGTCKTAKEDCAPFKCAGKECATECESGADCSDGAYCNKLTKRCDYIKDQAASCAYDEQCKSGHCADGVCCDTACQNQCEACSLTGSEGTCKAIATGDQPIAPRQRCDGGPDTTCHGACDGGDRTACKYPGETTLCPATRCQGNVLEPVTCDGQGSCAKRTSDDCGDYACDEAAGACKKSCSTDADCKASSVCDMAKKQCAPSAGTCKDAFTAKRPDGTETPCSPYRCSNGVCRDSCAGASDCADGYTCKGGVCEEGSGGAPSAQGGGGQAGGQPTAQGGAAGSAAATPVAAEAPAEEGGCGCRTVPARSDGRAALALGLALAAIARRRGSKRKETR